MERFTILAFHNSCGKTMHISYRTSLRQDRQKDLRETLDAIDGVMHSRGSSSYNLTVDVAPSYDMIEVIPQVIFALAEFLGQPLDEVKFNFDGDAVGIVNAQPFVDAALEIFNTREQDGELELIARRIKFHSDAIGAALKRYDELKTAAIV